MGLMKLAYKTTLKIAGPLGLDARIEELATRLAAFRRTVRVPRSPYLVWIEPTNTCNLNCVMCDRKAVSQRKLGFMDFELFTKIVDEAANLGVRQIEMGLGGEPLLHPRLIDMIEYIKNKGLIVGFNTNANLLDEQKARAVLGSGLDSIIFSVDGTNKETYEKIRLKGDYDIVTKNIKRFLSLKKEMGLEKPETTLQTLVMKGTESEIGAVIDMWHPLVDEVSVIAVTEYGDIRWLSLVHGDQNSPKIPCYLLWCSQSILWNGDVTVCCNDIGGELVIGNILEDSLRSLWRSDKLSEMRTILKKGELEKIPRCNVCQIINIDFIRKKNALVSEVTSMARKG